MKFKTTFKLFVAVCLLGSVVFLVDYRSGVKKIRKAEDHLLFDLSTDTVTGIVIVRNGLEIECVKKGRDWFLKKPVRARADAAEVERIAAMLEMAKWEEHISAEQRELRGLSLDDYGLGSPSTVITVNTDVRSTTVFIGDKVPLGGGLYARRNRSDDVLTLPLELVSKLPDSIESLRDRFVLHGTPDETVRLEIARQGAGFIQLVRQNGGWMVQQPFAARADASEIQALLESLYSLKIETFFWDVRSDLRHIPQKDGSLEMASSARIESCGLAGDSVQMRITVWVAGDSLGQELLLGKPDSDQKGAVFAKRGENDAIYSVKDDILETCGCDLNSLRDRTLFSAVESDVGYIELKAGETGLVLVRDAQHNQSWNIAEPVQWEADTQGVNILIKRILSLSVGKYLKQPVDGDAGFSLPQFTVAIGAAAPGDSEKEDGFNLLAGGGQLIIGGLYDESHYFAKMDGKDEVFAVAVADMDWLRQPQGVAPLYYRDRTMLAVKPEHVQRISVSTASGECGVERNSEQKWICIGQQKMPAEVDSVKTLLTVISNIRAESIEEHNPKSLKKYGLDAPAVTVTIGLQGEDNIQKSIMLGKPGSSSQHYAMVRGQDLVFPVSSDLAAVFSAPLCVAGAAGTNHVPVANEVE